ncbi:hypothetical protein QFZ24_008272 [Streptomyces phaeochromogenes]|nr:hypothetical protein [Streptomyces phaeochromogenes]
MTDHTPCRTVPHLVPLIPVPKEHETARTVNLLSNAAKRSRSCHDAESAHTY